MSDERLRELERRAEQGDLEARAALEREGRRSGGRFSAVLAYVTQELTSATYAAAHVSNWDREAQVRVQVAAARAAYAALIARLGPFPRDCSDARTANWAYFAITDAEAWVVAGQPMPARPRSGSRDDAWWELLRRSFEDPPLEMTLPDELFEGFELSPPDPHVARLIEAAIRSAEGLAGVSAVRSLIRDEVGAWARGERDAIRERFEARRAGALI